MQIKEDLLANIKAQLTIQRFDIQNLIAMINLELAKNEFQKQKEEFQKTADFLAECEKEIRQKPDKPS